MLSNKKRTRTAGDAECACIFFSGRFSPRINRLPCCSAHWGTGTAGRKLPEGRKTVLPDADANSGKWNSPLGAGEQFSGNRNLSVFCKEGKSEVWEVSEADRRIPDGRAESHAERVAGKDTAHFDIQSVLADTDEAVFVIILSVQKLSNEFNAGSVLVPCE